MSSLLNDSSILNTNNNISCSHGGKSVCDHYGCSAFSSLKNKEFRNPRGGIAQSVERRSAWSYTVSGGMIGPGFEPQLSCSKEENVEENGSALMLVTKRSSSCHTRDKSLPSRNKAGYSGFETQRRCQQESKTRVSVASQEKDLCPPNFFETFWGRGSFSCVSPIFSQKCLDMLKMKVDNLHTQYH